MTLKLYRGIGGTDFRTQLLEDLIATHDRKPQDTRFFYVVPNHIKFNAEVSVLNQLNKTTQGKAARPQVEVYSLTRLAWALMGGQLKEISDVALNMIVFQILSDNSDIDDQFKRGMNRQGYIEQIAQQIKEVRQSSLTPQDLTDYQNNSQDEILKRKLKNLSIVLEEVNKQIENKFTLNGEVLNVFLDWIIEHQTEIRNFYFYFEGFSGFTSIEQQVVTTLSKISNVEIGLIGTDNKTSDNLFRKVNNLAQELEPTDSINLTQSRLTGDIIQLFEQAWRELETTGDTELQTKITTYKASNREAELEQIARTVRQKVQDENLRFKDILVVARDLSGYQSSIKSIFDRFEIPIYIDDDQTLNEHSFAEMLMALFELSSRKNNYLPYENMMRLLKSELLIPEGMTLKQFRETLWKLENYVLANNRFDWTKHWDSKRQVNVVDDDTKDFQEYYEQESINKLREFAATALDDFRLAINATTINQAIDGLYSFIQNYQINQRMIEDVIQSEKNRRAQHIWRVFTRTIGEISEVFGQQTFD
ncbi:MAG: exodeoxyribonuclease V subunit gamma, partial [Lactobacillaceae bacterium]|nr:exodeoxyribonuclease V subunit gamma [Lactobacillaceae bacterium]